MDGRGGGKLDDDEEDVAELVADAEQFLKNKKMRK